MRSCLCFTLGVTVASVQPVDGQGCCLSGCLSANPVVEGVLLHVVRPGGGRHAAVRVQKDPETADDQQTQEDEEDEDKDEGRSLLEREERGGGRRGRGGGGEVRFRGGEGAAVEVVGHVGTDGWFRRSSSSVQASSLERGGVCRGNKHKLDLEEEPRRSLFQ